MYRVRVSDAEGVREYEYEAPATAAVMAWFLRDYARRHDIDREVVEWFDPTMSPVKVD